MKKQQEAIERCNQLIKPENANWIGISNQKAITTALDMLKEKNAEIEKKDEIIDLMAETINNHDIDEDICKQMGNRAHCNEFADKEKCKECIKQYFVRKCEDD